MNKKHVLITGGAKGIGEATARKFYTEGYDVSILDLDDDKGRSLQDELGRNSLFIKTDVAESREVDKAVKACIDQFGELDVLVNNAGIVMYGSVTETSEESWDRVMGVNLKSHFLCARACIPSMQKKGKGIVINVASVQAFICQDKVASYASSKAAILGLTRSIAVDYAPNIRSVAICPGSIDTPMLQEAVQQSPDPEAVYRECEAMHLNQRVGQPQEVAELIYFVASDKATFINGQALRIDGGLGIHIGGGVRD